MRPPSAPMIPAFQDTLELRGDDPARVEADGHPAHAVRGRGERHRAKRELVRKEVVARGAKHAEHLRERVRIPERHRRNVVRRGVIRGGERGHGAERVREPRAVAVLERGAEETRRGRVVCAAEYLRRRGGPVRAPGGDGVVVGNRGDFVVYTADWAEAVVGIACKG